MFISRPYTLSRLLAILTAAVLLLYIVFRLRDQSGGLTAIHWQVFADYRLLALSVLLLVLNLSVETFRWKLLVDQVSPEPLLRVAASYVTGIACSILTPARIGDYPGRILYLRPSHSGKLRYLSVAVTGLVAQYITVLFFGISALVVSLWQKLNGALAPLLWITIPVTLLMVWLYLRSDKVLGGISAFPAFRRLGLYRELARRLPDSLKTNVVLLSVVRFVVYNAQFLVLLGAMGVNPPLWQGATLSVLFFWIMTLIPSFALAEVGIRGGVALFLFGSVSGNTIGILSATTLLWLFNLILPAIPGAFCIGRLRVSGK